MEQDNLEKLLIVRRLIQAAERERRKPFSGANCALELFYRVTRSGGGAWVCPSSQNSSKNPYIQGLIAAGIIIQDVGSPVELPIFRRIANKLTRKPLEREEGWFMAAPCPFTTIAQELFEAGRRDRTIYDRDWWGEYCYYPKNATAPFKLNNPQIRKELGKPKPSVPPVNMI